MQVTTTGAKWRGPQYHLQSQLGKFLERLGRACVPSLLGNPSSKDRAHKLFPAPQLPERGFSCPPPQVDSDTMMPHRIMISWHAMG